MRNRTAGESRSLAFQPFPPALSRLSRRRYLEAGAALDMTDQRADVIVARTLEHRVLVDQTRGLTDPHRHPQLFPLRDGEIDILHQDVQRRAVAERAVQHRVR